MFKLMFPGKKQRWGLALMAGGLLLLVLGIVWMTVMFPGMTKMPCDFSSATQMEGTVMMLNTSQPVTMNVAVDREYAAISCEGDVVFIEEEVSFINSDYGVAIDQLSSNSLYGIDRATRQHVPGEGDSFLSGYFTLPGALDKDTVYEMVIKGFPETVECRYVGEEDFNGLHVYNMRMETEEGGQAIAATEETPEMRMYVIGDMKVEPVSGTTVYSASVNTRTMMMPNPADSGSYMEVTLFESDLAFTDAAVDELVISAAEHKSQITMYGSTLPWVIIIIGILEMALGVWMSGIVKIIKYVMAMKKQKNAG